MTLKEAQTYFRYEDGVLYWKDHWSPSHRTQFKGKPAGIMLPIGYLSVGFKHKKYYNHQIIWFLEKGEWPNVIDHIDGNTLNNRIENLRNVTRRVNQNNLKAHRNGKLVGASWDPKRRKYACMISIQGKYKHLGRFNTAEEAHARYMQVARENGLL